MAALIQIVDEHDRPTGAATKQEAWDKGLIHRVVRIMIQNSQGQLLLQLRSPTKDIFPNCWDNSVAGHVDQGEDYDTAAHREVTEEIGEADLALEPMGMYRQDETIADKRFNRFVKVYRAHLNRLPAQLEADKVSAVRWFDITDVQQIIAEHPALVTDGLRQVIERYY
ncbi:MAG TPA: NUDIX domain-containing protein [Nevskiaceae bacterium]|nr:NUDIX domain-containing protein [Nevskiaceae bacterium]